MDSRSTSIKPVLHRTARGAWYAFGFWLQVVIVGVGMLTTGVALLLDRIHSPVAALVWLIGGGALAAFAWRCSSAALRRLHRAEERAERADSSDNLRARHHTPGAMPATLFGLSAAATALE